MKTSLHPGAIAAILGACVVLLVGVFLRFGSPPTTPSSTASPYSRIGERPTSAGSGVNSLTGEPLTDTAKAYEASSFTQHTSPPSGVAPSGR